MGVTPWSTLVDDEDFVDRATRGVAISRSGATLRSGEVGPTTEKSQGLTRAIYVVLGIVIGAFGWWGLQKLWHHAGELDAQPLENGVRDQLNERKAEAMHDLLDALVDGKLDRVEAAADRMEASKKAVGQFLSTESYAYERAAFFKAIDDVQAAAADGDLEATKEATLSLERSCLNCHSELNE